MGYFILFSNTFFTQNSGLLLIARFYIINSHLDEAGRRLDYEMASTV